MAHLHLIDATYELFRAFYAMPSEKSPEGAEVGAIRGLIGSLASLLRQPQVTHVAAATDHVIESFRNDLFEGYKTGAGIDPDLWSQFPLAEEALAALGIVCWPMVELEADDALATAASRWADDFEKVWILSPDKDLCQCVRDARIVTFDRRRKKEYDEAAVLEKFGVPPASIPDLLALVGDAADGIPGIPKWGRKTAASVLRVYGTIEAIPGDVDRWTCKPRGARAVADRLRQHRDDALLYKDLATLRTDAPLAERLEDLCWSGVGETELETLRRRCGFGELAALRALL